MMESKNTADHFRRRIGFLKEAFETLWPGSEEEARCRDACDRALADMEEIGAQSRISATIVPVMGNKNAGKSTFCQFMLDADEASRRLGTGLGRGNATVQLTWIGPEPPVRWDRKREDWIDVGPAQMFQAGAPYCLVDVPGFNDADQQAREAAERVVPIATVLVLVLSWESGLEIERLGRYLELGGGATIVPVIVDDAFSERSPKILETQFSRVRSQLSEYSPDSLVLEPVHLPRFDAVPPEEREEYRAVAKRLSREALRLALASKQAQPARLIRIRYEHLVGELQKHVAVFLEPVLPSYDRFQESEQEAMHQIVGQLIGSRPQLTAGVRTRLMHAASYRCGKLLFPFPAFMRILAVTAGAWDRLILSLTGSIPSLAFLVFQGGRNVDAIRKKQTLLRGELRERIEFLIKDKIAEPHRRFLNTLRENLPKGAKIVDGHLETSSEFEGFPLLEHTTQAIVEKNIEHYAPPKGTVNTFAALGAFLWIALAIGPIWAVYGEFISASSALVAGQTSPTWEAFPVPSVGMLFSSAFLIFLPVFLLAMFTLGILVTKRRVGDCCHAIEQESKTEFQRLVDNGMLSLRTREKLGWAMSLLLQEFMPDDRPDALKR